MSGHHPQGSWLRQSLRFVTIAWLFGAAWLYIVTGAALTRLAKELGLPEFGYGILAALPFLGALTQLPAGYILERYGHRKKTFIVLGLVHRLMWLFVALIPWVAPVRWQWVAFLWLVGLSWTAGQMIAPAWISWMADLVPGRIRGRYFSRRSQLGQLTGLLVTTVIGFLLDKATESGTQAMMYVLSGMIAVAGVCGAFDFLLFLPVPELEKKANRAEVSFLGLIRTPLRDRSFRRFIGFTATLTFSIGYVGQFVWLYLFDVAGMSNTQANLMLVVMPLVVLMIFNPIWGRLIDRLGRKPVLIIAGLLIVHGGMAWIFVTKDQWLWGYVAVIVATAAWPGIELANFNIMLMLSDKYAGKPERSGYVAVCSLFGALAGVLSGLFGGAVAEGFKDWQGTLWGWPVTYHGLLFIISGALRLAALGWLVGLEDQKAYSTRAALRYMGTNLYSNLQQAVFLPGRMMQRVTKWTYIIRPGKQPQDKTS